MAKHASVLSPEPNEGKKATSCELPVDVLPEDSDPDLLGEFLSESKDYLSAAEAAMMALESQADDQESLNTVFRAFHTIKGTSAFLGFRSVSELAHRAESLLSRTRDGEIRCSGPFADLVLRAVDVLNELFRSIAATQPGSPIATPDRYLDLCARLEEATGSDPRDDRPGSSTESEVATEQNRTGHGDPAAAEEEATGRRVIGGQISRPPANDGTIRVRTDLLDRLIDAVGELVTAYSILETGGDLADSGEQQLWKKVTHVGRVVRELQEVALGLRMVPLKPVFQRIARLVRDLSQTTEKSIELQLSGEDTEIDRKLVEGLADPLLHMVRNAVDHGIERPEVRRQLGKPPAGTLRLTARRTGGQVVIELSDDGKGLDRDAIRRRAAASGLLDPEAEISDRDLFKLIFVPGLSTAAEVSDLSGRGVGMDVVKRNIEALRGRIEVHSVPGRGTTFTLRLPLTLALCDGLLLRVGREIYVLPVPSVEISLRPRRDTILSVAGRCQAILFRGELLPIVRLHRLFRIDAAVTDPAEAFLVILRDGSDRCALLVDEILGQQQVVEKPMNPALGVVPGISAAAILGDGRVRLVLDPSGILEMARRDPGPGDGIDVEHSGIAGPATPVDHHALR